MAALKRSHGSSREVIVAALRADIIEGRLPPGTPLRTEVVMERFGVSNSPLREAFAQLAAEGLLDVQPNRGAVVAPLTQDSAADLLRVGALLWEPVYRWSLPRVTAGDVASLRRASVDFDLAYASGDSSMSLIEAERFDELVLARCGSPELARAVNAGRPRLKRLVRMLTTYDHLEARERLHARALESVETSAYEPALEALSTYWERLTAALAGAVLQEIAP